MTYLDYKAKYPMKGDSIRVQVEGYGPKRVKVFTPKTKEDGVRFAAMGTFDHKGVTFFAAQQTDAWGYPEREKPWVRTGEALGESRRSRAAKQRFTPSAAQKAEIDARVLKLLDEWGDGGVESVGLLAEDLFHNRGWGGTDDWAFDAYWGKKKQRAAVSSSLKRLEKEGLVYRGEWVYRGRNEWQRWVHHEREDALPSWRRRW